MTWAIRWDRLIFQNDSNHTMSRRDNIPGGDAVELTREQLYQKVWATPAVKHAKELGISDVAIGKICKKYDIPKPPSGYWSKVQHGRKVQRTPLPKRDDLGVCSIVVEPSPAHLGVMQMSASLAE